MNKGRCYLLNIRGLANAEMVRVRKVMTLLEETWSTYNFKSKFLCDGSQPILPHTYPKQTQHTLHTTIPQNALFMYVMYIPRIMFSFDVVKIYYFS